MNSTYICHGTDSVNGSDEVIFGAQAVALKRAGLAVLPASGKKPIRTNFQKWKHAPGIKTVEKWAQTNPNDNIVYVPGLSRSRHNPNGIVVVDSDGAEESALAEKTWGWTPGMIDTRRADHRLYRAPEEPIPFNTLRDVDIEIDFKHGQAGAGISVAPPSRHPDQTDFVYAWAKGSGPGALTALPVFNLKALLDLKARGSKTLHNETQTAPRPPESVRGTARTLGKAFPHLFRDGSRKLGLNDHLVSHAWAIDDIDACLDVAQTWNDNLWNDHGIERLPNTEVIEVCHSITKDLESGRLVRKRGHRATCMSDADEVRALLERYHSGDSAFALLMLFRAEHDARCRRGETFLISIKSMIEKGTCGSWCARKYRVARDILLREGLIELVVEARGTRAAEYRLSERLLTISVAERERAAVVA